MSAIRHAVLDTTNPQMLREANQDSLAHRHPSIRKVLGQAGWLRLPDAVQARFADDVSCAEYHGSFDIVRASIAGRLLACLCRLIGTPIAPYTGTHIPAIVRVFTNRQGGMVWERHYRFSAHRTCI